MMYTRKGRRLIQAFQGFGSLSMSIGQAGSGLNGMFDGHDELGHTSYIKAVLLFHFDRLYAAGCKQTDSSCSHIENIF